MIASSVVLARCAGGAGAQISKAIIDRGCVIPEGMRIGQDPEEDRENGLRVTKGGVVLVTRGMLGQAEGTM
jgi:glucose-1-phosphate adenylyltransferase